MSSAGEQLPRAPLLGRGFRHGVHDCYALLRDWYAVERGVNFQPTSRAIGHPAGPGAGASLDLYRQHFERAGFREIDRAERTSRATVSAMSLRAQTLARCTTAGHRSRHDPASPAIRPGADPDAPRQRQPRSRFVRHVDVRAAPQMIREHLPARGDRRFVAPTSGLRHRHARRVRAVAASRPGLRAAAARQISASQASRRACATRGCLEQLGALRTPASSRSMSCPRRARRARGARQGPCHDHRGVRWSGAAVAVDRGPRGCLSPLTAGLLGHELRLRDPARASRCRGASASSSRNHPRATPRPIAPSRPISHPSCLTRHNNTSAPGAAPVPLVVRSCTHLVGSVVSQRRARRRGHRAMRTGTVRVRSIPDPRGTRVAAKGGSKGGDASSTHQPSVLPNTLRAASRCSDPSRISRGPTRRHARRAARSAAVAGLPRRYAGPTRTSVAQFDLKRVHSSGPRPAAAVDPDPAYLAGRVVARVSRPNAHRDARDPRDQLAAVGGARHRSAAGALWPDQPVCDVTGASVSYTIDVAVGAGPWINMLSETITGKTMSPYERAVRIELPYTTSTTQVRLSRIDPEPAPTTINDIFWASYVEIIDGQIAYDDTALAAMSIDAEEFPSPPQRAYLLDGQPMGPTSLELRSVQQGDLCRRLEWHFHAGLDQQPGLGALRAADQRSLGARALSRPDGGRQVGPLRGGAIQRPAGARWAGRSAAALGLQLRDQHPPGRLYGAQRRRELHAGAAPMLANGTAYACRIARPDRPLGCSPRPMSSRASSTTRAPTTARDGRRRRSRGTTRATNIRRQSSWCRTRRWSPCRAIARRSRPRSAAPTRVPSDPLRRCASSHQPV